MDTGPDWSDLTVHGVRPFHTNLLSCVHFALSVHVFKWSCNPMYGGQLVEDAVALWYAVCADIRVQQVRINENQQVCYCLKAVPVEDPVQNNRCVSGDL